MVISFIQIVSTKRTKLRAFQSYFKITAIKVYSLNIVASDICIEL